MGRTLQSRGFVNAHSHAFQRALRGRTEGADFWSWRDTMLELAAGQTPERVRSEYAAVYAEMRAAGYTAVGEFHYLGLAEAHAAAEAAAEAGIESVLLYVAYARGGIDRFRQESVAEYLRGLEELRAAGVRVGVAPHSVRACPRDWLEELGRYAAEHELPLHVHADEQPREIEECLAEHGMRPI
jgi:formimidoylglutamate deiminase